MRGVMVPDALAGEVAATLRAGLTVASRNGRRPSSDLQGLVDELIAAATSARGPISRETRRSADLQARLIPQEVDTRAAADLLNVTERHVRRYIDRGALKARQVGGRWLITKASVDELRNDRHR